MQMLNFKTSCKSIDLTVGRVLCRLALAAICALLLVSGVFLCSCSSKSSNQNTPANYVEDINGNKYDLDQPHDRLMVTHISVVNYVVALGQQNKLCAIAEGYKDESLYRKVVQGWDQLPRAAYGKKLYPEQAVKANPELAILPERYSSTIQEFDNINIPTFLALPEVESFENNFETCLRIGKLLGCQDKAQQLVDFCKGVLDKSSAKSSDTKVLFLGTEKMTAYHKGMIQDQIIEAAGGKDAISDTEPVGSTAKIDYETIVSANPDQIWIPSYASYGVSDILNDEKLQTVNAVKNGKVYIMPCKADPWDYPTMSCCLGVAWGSSKIAGDAKSAETYNKTVQDFYQLEYGCTPEQLGIEY